MIAGHAQSAVAGTSRYVCRQLSLPDGRTLAPGWQGWRLGSHLLDILVAAAAARGVPNLQADIMLDNTRMLALLSRRGYLTLDQYGLREARVAIGAAQPARGGRRWRGSPEAA